MSWNGFHRFLQCLVIFWLIDVGFSIREQKRLDKKIRRISTNFAILDEPGTTPDSPSDTETEITSPISSINDPGDSETSSENKLAELTKIVKDNSSEFDLIDNHVKKKLIKKKYEKLKMEDELDAINTIDTSGDDLDTKKYRDSESIIPNITICRSVEISTTYMSDQLPDRLIKRNLDSLEETTEEPEGDSNEVKNLTLSDMTPNSLTVFWNRPSTSMNVTYYLVKWSLSDNTDNNSCIVTDVETDTHKIEISPLMSCRMYVVKVTPYEGSNPGKERVGSAATKLNVSNKELDLKVTNTTTDSITINWSMPGMDCVSHYTIKTCHDPICDEARVNATVFTKTNLKPCWTYFFNLTVESQDAKEPYGTTNITGTTVFQEPQAPLNIKTVSGNHTLNVSWTEPIGHTCADHYYIGWSHKGVDKNATTNSTSILLADLEACAVYDIRIKSVWDDGQSEEKRVQSNMTAPDLIDPPVALEEPRIGKDNVSIKWWIGTNRTNNCVPFRLIVACSVEKALGEGYDPMPGSYDYLIKDKETNITFDMTVVGLSAFTKYKCCGVTFNTGGRSPEQSDPIYFTTLEDVPSPPKLLPALQSNVTNTSITLMWEKPAYLPGILRNFTIGILWDYKFVRPPWCGDAVVMNETISITDGSATSYFYKAKPKSHYRIKIYASTGAGKGDASDVVDFFTTPGIPSNVTNFHYEIIQNSEDSNKLDVNVTWGLPCYVNSDKIEHFEITGSGTRQGYDEHKFTQIVNKTDKNLCTDYVCSLVVKDLKEEHAYVFRIATKVEEYVSLGIISELTFDFPAGIPPEPDENYTSLITMDPYKARRTTSTATVLLPVFPDTGGTIRCYAIIVAKLGFNNGTFGRITNDSSQPHVASWIESKLEDFVIPYQAVKFCVNSYPTYVTDYGRFKAVNFVLGEDTETCPELSSNRFQYSYCNGPLKPDMWYHVRMRAFTSGGYRDSIVFTVKTNAELQIGVVIGTIFGILFLGILATMMLLVRKCSLQAVVRRFLHSDMPGSPVPAPFTRRKFIAHCQQLADNPGKLSNEFQLLQTLSVDLQMPTNAACLQANRKKNRYTDILPYDFSRVKLEVIDNDPNSDYINASFIKGFTGEEDYIACQGPKEETTYDFWRMIDQYNVKIIVMLTQLVEKNKEKCHQYFPTIRETFTYENMSIKCTSEFDYRTYTDRTLVLQKENQKRTIIHLHFKDWPDHDVPEDFDPMINFCQIMRRHIEANRGLVVVHCSAGIGRTGTLIAIDILLQHIKENRKLDVFGTVYRLRHHRINMVQRESQYAYIYNCIKQVLKNPYFSKNYKPPSVDPIFDTNSHRKKEGSDSGTNLVSSLETLKKSSFSTSAASAEPIYEPSSDLIPQTCHSFAGLRCAKSTSAIDTRPCQELTGKSSLSHIVIGSTDMKDSDVSLDITDSEGSTTSLYENMQPLLRSKSAHTFGREEDRYVIRGLLENDTSL